MQRFNDAHFFFLQFSSKYEPQDGNKQSVLRFDETVKWTHACAQEVMSPTGCDVMSLKQQIVLIFSVPFSSLSH